MKRIWCWLFGHRGEGEWNFVMGAHAYYWWCRRCGKDHLRVYPS